MNVNVRVGKPNTAGERSMIKRCTLKDVAQATGLTVNSVSRALHDKDDISKETKKRVAEVAKQLGYVPNHAAAALKRGRGNTVAIVFDNLFNPYYNIMTHYLGQALARAGYDFLTIVEPHEMLGAGLYDKLLSRNVDGVISFLEPGEEFAQKRAAGALPMAVIGRHCDAEGIDYIYTDDVKGGYLASEYLYNKGSRRLAFITDSLNISCARERHEGFLTFVREKKLVGYEMYADGSTYSEAVTKLLDAHPDCDGLFCYNDYIALEALYHLRKRGMERVDVIGYDDIRREFRMPGRYASVAADKAALAGEAVKLVVSRIEGEYEGASRSGMLGVALVEGEE